MDERTIVSEAAKEKIKLRAAYINGMANAFIVAGALTIPLSVAANALDPAFGIPFSAVCFAISVRLHLLAQKTLEGLDP